MKTVYIALGSNLGDRAENLREARERMAGPELTITRQSSIYETAPRDLLDQPSFLNQVVAVETSLLPRQLLQRLLKIEIALGRKRMVPNGPRVIDLDILLFGDSLIDTPDLKVPHPRMTARRFVLEPLAEIAPSLRLPGNRRMAKEILADVSDQVVRKL